MSVKNEAVVLRERCRCLLCWGGVSYFLSGSCVALGSAMFPKALFFFFFPWQWSHRAFCFRAVWFLHWEFTFLSKTKLTVAEPINRGQPLVIPSWLILHIALQIIQFFVCVGFPAHQPAFEGVLWAGRSGRFPRTYSVSGFICCFAFLQATTPSISVCTCPRATGVGGATVGGPATRTKRRSWQKTPLTSQKRKTPTTRATAFWSLSVSGDGHHS